MKTSACRDRTLENQPNQIDMSPQHFHTIPIHLVPFGQLWFVFLAVCIGGLWKAAGWVVLCVCVCVVHVDVPPGVSYVMLLVAAIY